MRSRHGEGGGDGTSIASCGPYRGTSLLNIGLVWARATKPGGGGVLAAINGTYARFAQTLDRPRTTPGGAAPQHVETLIDQPMMRRLVEQLSVAEPGKPAGRWTLVPGGAAPIYDEATTKSGTHTASSTLAGAAAHFHGASLYLHVRHAVSARTRE